MKKIVVTVLLATLALAAPQLAAGAPAAAQAAVTAQETAGVQPLDLNRATREQLVGIPGIGEKLAEAIIELRSKKGRFSSVEELLGVRGIGENSLKRLAPHLTVVATSAAAGGGSEKPVR